jgi:hypothetical protein
MDSTLVPTHDGPLMPPPALPEATPIAAPRPRPREARATLSRDELPTTHEAAWASPVRTDIDTWQILVELDPSIGHIDGRGYQHETVLGLATPKLLASVDLTERQRTFICDEQAGDGATMLPRYAVRTVEAPRGMRYEDVLRRRAEVKAWCENVFHLTFPTRWNLRLLALPSWQRAICSTMLTCWDGVDVARSRFEQSLRGQVIAWLNDDEPRYPSPLSRRQWASLGHDPDQEEG